MSKQAVSILLTISIVLAVIASAAYIFKPAPAASIQSGNASAEKLSRLEERIDQLAKQLGRTNQAPADNMASLTEEIARLKQQFPSNAPAPASSPQNTLAEAMTLLQDPEVRSQLAELVENNEIEQAREITQTFDEEVVDEAWAPGTEAKIANAVSSLDGATILSSECHSTLCKVEIDESGIDASSGEDALDNFENRLLSSLGEGLPYATMQSTPNGTGGMTYSITFVREGHPMPRANTALNSAHSIEDFRALVGR